MELMAMFESDFFLGGLGLALLAFLGMQAKTLGVHAWYWIERNFTTTIIFDSHDPVYAWAEAWLGKYLDKMNTGHKRITKNNVDASDNMVYRVLPRPGFYVIKYGRKRVMIYYWRKRIDSFFGGSAFHESIFIWYWGRDEELFTKIVEEGRDLSLSQYPGKMVVYVNNYGSWEIHSVRERRSLDTVIFADNVGSEIVSDLEAFLENKKRYNDLGIQWKRGYLLHGPPGNGKSTTIFALASHFEMPLYVLHLSSLKSDQELMALFSKIPKNSILSIEDIDSTFDGRQSNNENISFSTFLNLFDGTVSKDGQLIFVTTNKYESLDEALIRNGRVDKIIEFKNADPNQVAAMAERFSNGHALKVDKGLIGKSMAANQERYLQEGIAAVQSEVSSAK
jgi:chaperone BCS1